MYEYLFFPHFHTFASISTKYGMTVEASLGRFHTTDPPPPTKLYFFVLVSPQILETLEKVTL